MFCREKAQLLASFCAAKKASTSLYLTSQKLLHLKNTSLNDTPYNLNGEMECTC